MVVSAVRYIIVIKKRTRTNAYSISARNFVFMRESSPHDDDNSSRIDREPGSEDKNDTRPSGESKTGLRTGPARAG